MKELSIEEKAKAYDEVREKIAIRFGSNVADEIFSQFEMSKDEKVRKNIIIALKSQKDELKDFYMSHNTSESELVAWLEKQGEPIDKEKVLIGARKDIALSIIKYLDNNSVGMCLSNMECEDIEDACINSKWTKLYNYMKKKLEKQGDKDKLIQELGEYKVKYTQEVLSQYLEKQGGQNQPDKIESKFKVGDWIINGTNTTIMQIIDNKDFYESIGIDGQRRTDKHNYVERNFRLWSIKDAKEGDVLVASDKSLFIYDGSINENGSVGFHIAFTKDMDIILNSDDGCGWEGKDFCHPAIKEQRDLLFKKMKESGYEWDADAKKLNKFEQKTDSGWSEEDERMLNHIIGYLHSGDDFQTGIDWLESLKQRIGYEIEVRNIN